MHWWRRKNLGRAEYENLKGKKKKKFGWRTKKSLINYQRNTKNNNKIFVCLFACFLIFIVFQFLFHFLNVFDLRFNFERDGETFGGTSESRWGNPNPFKLIYNWVLKISHIHLAYLSSPQAWHCKYPDYLMNNMSRGIINFTSTK